MNLFLLVLIDFINVSESVVKLYLPLSNLELKLEIWGLFWGDLKSTSYSSEIESLVTF